MKTAPNFQFSIFNFQSIPIKSESNLNVFKFKFKNSFRIINFKLKIILVFCLIGFLFTASSVSAQANSVSQYAAPNTNPDVPQNLHTWTQNVMIETMSAMSCQLTGIDPVNLKQKCLGIDQKTGKIGFVDGGGGAVGLVSNFITMTFTPPLHTSDYINYLAQNFGIAKPAYAQGVGFKGITPLVKLWSVFRNIVYFLFIVLFVIVGVAIMLRVKIDPRTVMSIENQIPKIIIGLILVTFSFAIAGFLIDMMYVMIYLIFGLISSGVDPSVIKVEELNKLNPAVMQGKSALGAVGGFWDFGKVVGDGAGAASDIVKPLFIDNPIGKALGTAIAGALGLVVTKSTGLLTTIQAGGSLAATALCAATGVGIAATPVCAAIGGTVATIVSGVVSGAAGYAYSNEILGTVVSVITFLIIAIALLWALFRLWFALLTAYIFILVDVITVPLWIVGGMIPGTSFGFGLWLRDIGANLLAFPLTILLLLLGKIFMSAIDNSSGLFVPPLIGNAGNPSALSSLIGLGVILMAPQALNMTRDALKAPPFKYTAAVGQAIGVGPAMIGSLWTAVASPYGFLHGLETVKGYFKKGEDPRDAAARKAKTNAAGPKAQEDQA